MDDKGKTAFAIFASGLAVVMFVILGFSWLFGGGFPPEKSSEQLQDEQYRREYREKRDQEALELQKRIHRAVIEDDERSKGR